MDAGLKRVYFTGGEPLTSPLARPVVQQLPEQGPDASYTLITNGTRVRTNQSWLANTRLDKVKVSLHYFSDESLRAIAGTRIGIDTVLDGIEATRETFPRVELNTLLQKENAHEVHSPAHTAFFSGFLPKLPQPGQYPRLWECRPPAFKTVGPQTFVFDAPSLLAGLEQHGYRTVCIGGVTYLSRETHLGSVLPALFQEDHWRPEFCSPEIDSTRHPVGLALELDDKYDGLQPSPRATGPTHLPGTRTHRSEPRGPGQAGFQDARPVGRERTAPLRRRLGRQHPRQPRAEAHGRGSPNGTQPVPYPRSDSRPICTQPGP